jgi:SAM-dependent methyltransferase
MSKLQDSNYLLTEQYRDATNLNARLRLHILFSTNQYNWFLWVFDQFDLPQQCRILELGCGPGDMWLENRHRIPADWKIIMSDFSSGMVEQAKQNLQELPHGFTYQIIDAQTIPYPDDHFDAVIANHVFHHVPQIDKSLEEIRRVLKSGGPLYATSVGEKHLSELPALVAKFDPKIGKQSQEEEMLFTLEDGHAPLADIFTEVRTLRQENGLRITEAEPLADYIMSSAWYGNVKDRQVEFVHFLEQELANNEGIISITKDSGIFIAR